MTGCSRPRRRFRGTVLSWKRSGRRAELGGATVLAVVLVGVLASAAVAGVAVGGILVGHRRAASAADLAALGAAQRLVAASLAGEPGEEEACAVADRVSRENDARLRSCGIHRTPLGSGAGEVTVEVEVDVEGPWGARWRVRARARAGGTGTAADAGPARGPPRACDRPDEADRPPTGRPR